MYKLSWFLFVGLCSGSLSASPKPHLIAMLMDDYGWANVGYHRTPQDDPHHEVRTPNIDALVASGVQLDRFYAHKFCSPTIGAFAHFCERSKLGHWPVQPRGPSGWLPGHSSQHYWSCHEAQVRWLHDPHGGEVARGACHPRPHAPGSRLRYIFTLF